MQKSFSTASLAVAFEWPAHSTRPFWHLEAEGSRGFLNWQASILESKVFKQLVCAVGSLLLGTWSLCTYQTGRKCLCDPPSTSTPAGSISYVFVTTLYRGELNVSSRTGWRGTGEHMHLVSHRLNSTCLLNFYKLYWCPFS